MDDSENDLRDLEAELSRLRPLAPSERLRAAVLRECAAPPMRPRRGARWWVTAPLAAAAAVALTWFVIRDPAPDGATDAPVARAATSEAAADEQFLPVEVAATPLADRSERYVTLADGTLARSTRETYLTTITWKNPRTKAALTWSVPREEVRVEPVSYQ